MNLMNYLGFSRRGEDPKADNPSPKGMNLLNDNEPRKEGERRIYNLVILDESGSMSPIREQALAGVNRVLETIRSSQNENPDDNQMFCLVTFDSGGNRPDVRAVIDCTPVGKVQDFTAGQYRPSGMTPLYDAIGVSVTALEKLVREGDNVLVTVITDGFENSSTIFNASSIKEMVDSLSAKGWVFTYIGANQESDKEAGVLGIHATMDFLVTGDGADIMWDKMRSGARQYYKKVRAQRYSGTAVDFEDDFFGEKSSLSRVTPGVIEDLADNQVFVFGSNADGNHALGYSSRLAISKFGAVMGQAEGLQGKSYAIPVGGVSRSEAFVAVERFIRFADAHPELTFFVTEVGCGGAGYSEAEMAKMFAYASSLPNVYLPASFWRFLGYKFGR